MKVLLLEAEGDDVGEDASHGLVVELVDGHDVEVAQEARSDRVASAPGGSHGPQELDVHQLQLAGVLLVVPAVTAAVGA